MLSTVEIWAMRPFTKCRTALSELNPQKPVFGCEQLSGWLLLSRYQKTGVHAAYPPSASRCACSAHREFTRKSQPSVASSCQAGFCSQGIKRPAYMPPTRLRRRVVLDQHNARLTRKSQPSVASSYQADFGSQGIKRPAYMPPAFDRLYSLRMYPSYLLLIFDGLYF